MKILCMCQGGNTRSVALKFILHYGKGHDALNCGWQSSTEETKQLLFSWADRIIIMHKDFGQYVPSKFHFDRDGVRKLYCFHVGDDRWTGHGGAFHHELQALLSRMVEFWLPSIIEGKGLPGSRSSNKESAECPAL